MVAIGNSDVTGRGGASAVFLNLGKALLYMAEGGQRIRIARLKNKESSGKGMEVIRKVRSRGEGKARRLAGSFEIYNKLL